MAKFEDLQKLDVRVGRIIDVQDFPETRNPTFKLKVDFGEEMDIMRSCAQLTSNYEKNALIDKLVLCVINNPPRQIGNAISEVLTLGAPDENNDFILIIPDRKVPLRGRLY